MIEYIEYVVLALLFVGGGLFEQFVKYRLGQEGSLKGKYGFFVGFFLEIAGYAPVVVFALWRMLASDYPRLAVGVPRALGVSLVLIGIAINIIAVRHLKMARWNSAPLYGKNMEYNSIITEGIYSVIRHPSYIGQIILFFGCAILVPSPYVITFSITYMLYLVLLHVPIEESYLKKRFGEQFIQYASSVPRFIPRLARKSHGQ